MNREINRTPRPSSSERLFSELVACRALIDAREKENDELRADLKRLWEAFSFGRDSWELENILDRIAAKYPEVKGE